MRSRKKLQRWVVKAGSNMVCGGGPVLIRSWMQQIVMLRNKYDIEVIWVTSGAISSAVDRISATKKSYRPAKWRLAEKQALSAIGQPVLMEIYNLALNATGLLGAQILLTYTELASKSQRHNFQQTIEELLKWKVVPIINENDAVATEEIKFGDNDTLSAKVAAVIEADKLVILTDVDGLYDSDPKKNKRARLIRSIRQVTPELLSRTHSDAGSSRGTGGMYSKLKAAKVASAQGIETLLIRGDLPAALVKLADGQNLGTLIESQKRSRR